LFQRAIIESGLPNIAPPTSLAAAEQAGADFAHAKNAASLAALRALPPADLLGPSKLPGGRSGPIVDGVLLPDAATKLAADGKSYDMPVLIGMVADENSALSPSYATADEATRLQMRERGLAALYAWGSERVAHSQQPVFVYLFTHTEPGPDSARYRAFHSAELPYVFGTLDKSPERNFTDADRGLARTVSSYWVNFVKTGDPNGRGLSSWPRFAPGNPQIMKLDVESAAQPVLPEQKLRAVRDDLAHGGHPSIF
jgi:para-nitrobenzyl esterase